MGQFAIWAPVGYVTLLISALAIFSHFYRKRLASRRTFESWYPSHPERDLYVSLLQKQHPPVPESLLKAALLRRAVTDVGRLVRIREDKQALQLLLQKGSIGDDLWNSCIAAEKELEAEILEVVNEANSFRQGWGTIIFASAGEILHHDKIKEALETMPKLRTDAEAKYGRKSLPQNTPAAPTVTGDASPAKPASLAPPSTTSANGAAQTSDEEPGGSGTTPSSKTGNRKARRRK